MAYQEREAAYLKEKHDDGELTQPIVDTRKHSNSLTTAKLLSDPFPSDKDIPRLPTEKRRKENGYYNTLVKLKKAATTTTTIKPTLAVTSSGAASGSTADPTEAELQEAKQSILQQIIQIVRQEEIWDHQMKIDALIKVMASLDSRLHGNRRKLFFDYKSKLGAGESIKSLTTTSEKETLDVRSAPPLWANLLKSANEIMNLDKNAPTYDTEPVQMHRARSGSWSSGVTMSTDGAAPVTGAHSPLNLILSNPYVDGHRSATGSHHQASEQPSTDTGSPTRTAGSSHSNMATAPQTPPSSAQKAPHHRDAALRITQQAARNRVDAMSTLNTRGLQTNNNATAVNQPNKQPWYKLIGSALNAIGNTISKFAARLFSSPKKMDAPAPEPSLNTTVHDTSTVRTPTTQSKQSLLGDPSINGRQAKPHQQVAAPFYDVLKNGQSTSAPTLTPGA